MMKFLMIGLTVGAFYACTPQHSETRANAQTLAMAASSKGLVCESVAEICTEYFGAGGDTTSEFFISSLNKSSNQCKSKISEIFANESVPVGIVACVEFLKEQGLKVAQ